MTYKYFPHTEGDVAAMLQKIGVADIDALYADVPESVRFRGDYDLPEGKSELELRSFFDHLGQQNRLLTVFAGQEATTTTLLP